MAKKERKPNLPQATLERARKELYGTAAAPTPTPPVAEAAVEVPPVPRPKAGRRMVDLREEYTYVLQDLKNMAMLAAALMALLIVLALSGVV